MKGCTCSPNPSINCWTPWRTTGRNSHSKTTDGNRMHRSARRSEPASEVMHRPKSLGSGEEAHVIDEPVGRPGDPCVMVIFGASGDLTKRKLIPALYNLAK